MTDIHKVIKLSIYMNISSDGISSKKERSVKWKSIAVFESQIVLLILQITNGLNLSILTL